MGKQAEGAFRYMEYLIRLLHKEWERSGRTRAEVVISLDEAGEINQKIAGQIAVRQKVLDGEGPDFKQGMDMSRENFILLRMAKKIRKEEEKVNRKGMDVKFRVELDKEEYKLFKAILEQ